MFCLCLFYKMVVGLFSAYVANFCTTGVLVIILILYLCLVLSAALWPSTVAYCQMAFTLLCEEGFYFVLRQKKKKTKNKRRNCLVCHMLRKCCVKLIFCLKNQVREVLESKGCQIRTRSEVNSVATNDEGE